MVVQNVYRRAQGKGAHEFDGKVCVVITALDDGFVVGMRSFVGNPCNGNALEEALEKVNILNG